MRLDSAAALPGSGALGELADGSSWSLPSVPVAVAASVALVAVCSVVGLGVWQCTSRRRRAGRALAYVHHREGEDSRKVTGTAAAVELAMASTRGAVLHSGGIVFLFI